MFNDPVNCEGHSPPDRVLRSNVPKGWRRLRYTPFGANVSCGGPWQCSARKCHQKKQFVYFVARWRMMDSKIELENLNTMKNLPHAERKQRHQLSSDKRSSPMSFVNSLKKDRDTENSFCTKIEPLLVFILHFTTSHQHD